MGSFSAAEFNEMFSTEEQEDYFAGAYDKSCEVCGGSGKVWVDTDVHDAALAEAAECPCAKCVEQLRAEAAQERKTMWYEMGCPDGYFEG